jgi:uncharacterized repeat protein (TIGR03803 family)
MEVAMRCTIPSCTRLVVFLLLSNFAALAQVKSIYKFPLSADAKVQVLYTFDNKHPDCIPATGLLLGPSGSLFGTSSAIGCGNVIYELAPNASGRWEFDTLKDFFDDQGGASAPTGTLIQDPKGNLYGTNGNQVFELQLALGGQRIFQRLHVFPAFTWDGKSPFGSLTLDSSGNIYGTTESGGRYKDCQDYGWCGVVFRLSKDTKGYWHEKVIHDFTGGPGGYGPVGGMVFDAAGNLYGGTNQGGVYGCGVVFELSPQADGSWTYTVLHQFLANNDGCAPEGNLILDAEGNLYGTTVAGGANAWGSVYELSPGANGVWEETVLHSFNNTGDGFAPYGGVVIDAGGNLYGTTSHGGPSGGGGVLFELRPGVNGQWNEEILLDSGSSYGLAIDEAGNLYGIFGGTQFVFGAIFEITP